MSFDEKTIPSPRQLVGAKDTPGVLLALSGGADSVALLEILSKQAEAEHFSLVLAHLNHGIRGAEADRDMAFCEQLAKTYRCRLEVRKADIPRLAAQSGRSVEEEAREARYAFFSEVMEKHGLLVLATAHHADDNLETLLFRLSRGTNLKGLCGILPVRKFGDRFLVRPLLSVSKKEILAFCAERNLPFVTDSTNRDISYSRNRIREKIVPEMEALFDNPQGRIFRLTGQLREDEAYLESLASDALSRAKLSGGLSQKKLLSEPLPIRRRMLASYLSEATGREPENLHLDGALAVASGDCRREDLPGGFFAVIEKDLFRVLPDTGASPVSIRFSPGETLLSEVGNIRIFADCENLHELSTEDGGKTTQTLVKIDESCYWRTRREGDEIFFRGMHRKLRKLYLAAKIPPRLRDRLPLLCDREGILWAPFIGLRDHADKKEDATLFRVAVTLPEKTL